MSDSPDDDKKTVPIYNKTTGVESRGESRKSKDSKSSGRTQDDTAPLQVGHSDTRADKPLAKASTDTPAARPKSSKDITRVFDIVKRFYTSAGAPKKISGPSLRKLEQRTISEVQHAELLDVAQLKDATLTRTLNLAFAAFEIHTNRSIKDVLLAFVANVARKNFDLPMVNSDVWLPRSSDAGRTDVAEIFRNYASRMKQLDAGDHSAKDKREQHTKLRNLLFLSLIWQVNQGRVRENEILRFLRSDAIFDIGTPYPSQAIEGLLKAAYAQSTTEFSPLGWLSQQVEKTRASQSNELKQLGEEVEQLKDAQAETLQKLEALSQEKQQLLASHAALEEQLQQEKKRALTDSVHLEDDKHRQRTRVSKTLNTEIPRLEDALAALQRDPPKLHIVSHYVEEAVNNLHKVLTSIEGE